MTERTQSSRRHAVIRLCLGIALLGIAVCALTTPLLADGAYYYNFQTVECEAQFVWETPIDCADCFLIWDACFTQCSECQFLGGTPEEDIECRHMCSQAKAACRLECTAGPQSRD